MIQSILKYSKMSSSLLFKLDAIGQARVWNYEKPTLVKESRFTDKLPTNSSETFSHMFYDTYPALKNLDMQNIMFKGGSILDLLIGQRARDLDLFLVGLDSDEAALERVKMLLLNFLQIEKDKVKEKRRDELQRCKERHRNEEYADKFKEEIKAVRQGNVITLSLSAVKIPIQIVLVRYGTVQDCLEDDDLGATAMAFDGKDVWLNERSKFAMENLTITLEPTRLSSLMPSRRIEKYFDKGFDIVLPQLDIEKLPRHYTAFPTLCDAAKLPGMTFAYTAVHGNKIFVEKFIHSREEQKEEEANTQKYLRAYGGGKEDDKMSRAGVLAENIFKLCNDQDDFGIFAEGDYLLDLLKIWPGIHERQINNFYQRFKKQMIAGTNFNFAIAKQYFGMYTLAQIADKLFSAKNMDEALKQLTQEHIKRGEQKLNEYLAKGKINELVAVVGHEQAEELFPRIYKEDAKQFYGDFFKAE